MKTQVQNYTFDKTAKTVTFTDFASILLQNVLLIVNQTSQIIIYQLNNTSLGGTVSTNVLTLEYDTSAMNNTDKLAVFYEDPTLDFWKKEDVAHASGDAGVMALSVRKDAPATTAGSDGDYAALTSDSSGRLRVSNGGLKTVTTASSGLTTGTYASGDMLGTQWTFSDVAAVAGGGFEIVTATIFCELIMLGPTDLFLFNGSVTQAADNAANTYSDSDMLKCIGVISFPAPTASGQNQISTVPNLSLFGHTDADAHLYGGLVSRVGITSPSFGADDITIRLISRRA